LPLKKQPFSHQARPKTQISLTPEKLLNKM